MLNIYEYPTCSTCRKQKLLTENSIEATYYNKRKTPTVDEFKNWIETFDLPLKII